MKKIISIIILMSCIVNAGIYKYAVEVLSSDLTNLNKSEYKIYSEVEDTDNLNGENLCLQEDFKVDSYTCKKPIYYIMSTYDEADVLILETGMSSEKLVICKEDTEFCDIVYGKKIDNINLIEKGYVPDPNRSK